MCRDDGRYLALVLYRFAVRRWVEQFKGDHVPTNTRVFEVRAPYGSPKAEECLANIIARRRLWRLP